MFVVHRLEDLPQQNTSVALGFFDGVHRGHTQVIRQVTASRADTVKTVLTFSRPAGRKADNLLMPLSLKRQAFESMGVQCLVVLPFEEIQMLSAQDFVYGILRERLHAREVSCGFNYRFGRHAAGDTELLCSLCEALGIEVQVADPVLDGGRPISSTRIRQALADGNAEEAARLLGRPFTFDFEVVQGDQRGRLLGAPTINQPFPQDFVQPRYGVYIASAQVEGCWIPAVTNIGIRPTVGADCLRAETYLLDYSGDLYGQCVPVRIHRFLRDEQRFDSLDALRRAIAQNADDARRYFAAEGE